MEELIKELRKAAKESFLYGDLMSRSADAIEDLSVKAANGETAYDIMVRQTDFIEELKKQLPHWIPVTERLPETHERVLVYSKATRMGRSIDFINSDGIWYTTPQVTHWMPLPEPPKEG